jgi:hypothetical protein
MDRPRHPVPVSGPQPPREVTGIIESVIADVPPPRTRPVSDAAAAARQIARDAAKTAAVVSGSLALPPGPLGMLTVLPDLYVIWKVQRQMVADLFGLYGRTAELTRTHMLYCLFRHMASHVLRDIAVRAGQRVVIQSASAGTLQRLVRNLGVSLTQRVAGTAASRWVPLAGAAAVGVYAYWDTLQVAKTARQFLDGEGVRDPAAVEETRNGGSGRPMSKASFRLPNADPHS